MNFGYGYSPVESTKVLDVGTYECQIVDVQIDHYNNGNQFLKVIFAVNGERDIQPNMLVLNDRPVLNDLKASGQPITQDDVKKWDKSMTKFFDCFGITRGSFNFKDWQFKKGLCKCNWQYDKNEPDHKSKTYKEFYPVLPQSNGQNAPQSVQAVQNTFAPEQTFNGIGSAPSQNGTECNPFM